MSANFGWLFLGVMGYVVIGVVAKDFLQVNRDITLKPTPHPPENIADSVNVTLNCTGSRTDINYYIKHMVSWTFISDNGSELILTSGFYESKAVTHLFRGPEARFALSYREVDEGYAFSLSLSRVTRADNGIYRCSIEDDNRNVIDSKDIRLTVTNPVQTVRIELLDDRLNRIATSSSTISQNAKPLYISPGQYNVICNVSGSNPEPVATFFLNEQKPLATSTIKEENNTEFRAYFGVFEVRNMTIHGHSATQALVCKANIPGDYYAPSEVGVVFIARGAKPVFACENVTAALGDKNRKLRCKVSDEDQNNDVLTCDSLGWLLGSTGQRIGPNQRWNDTHGEYGHIKTFCEKTEVLTAELDLFTVNSQAFKETFCVLYGHGKIVYEHRIKIYDVTPVSMTTVTASVHPTTTSINEAAVTVQSLLVCLVMTAILNVLLYV